MKIKCPGCDRLIGPDNEFRPFCSERCRLIDLGEWLEGSYRIPENDYSETLNTGEKTKIKH